MQSCSFVFIMVKNLSPDRMDRGDLDNHKYTIPYTRMRHANIEEHHLILCVGDALDIIIRKIDESGCSLDTIDVYTHSAVGGEFWGRLMTRDEEYREIDIEEAEIYRYSELRSARIAERATQKSAVKFHGCHLGRRPQAVMIYRDIFGVTRGQASAPKLFQNFCVGPFILNDYKFSHLDQTITIVRPKNPEIKNMDEFNAGVKEIAGAVEKLTEKEAEIAKTNNLPKINIDNVVANVYRLYNKMFDEDLYKRFEELRMGGELPWPGLYTMSRSEAIKKMQNLFNTFNSVPRTFMSSAPLDGCNKKMFDRAGDATIWPHEEGRWEDYHCHVSLIDPPRLLLKRFDL
jgi:hypothetical protein